MSPDPSKEKGSTKEREKTAFGCYRASSSSLIIPIGRALPHGGSWPIGPGLYGFVRELSSCIGSPMKLPESHPRQSAQRFFPRFLPIVPI
jgi:hypothetical protein